jgi:hypothetical protein
MQSNSLAILHSALVAATNEASKRLKYMQLFLVADHPGPSIANGRLKCLRVCGARVVSDGFLVMTAMA